jgi:hypothetical protein
MKIKEIYEAKKPNVRIDKEAVFACLLTLPFVVYAFVQFCLRINYEFTAYEIYDSFMYRTVGRGIVNGIAPYTGLWDIKPPGIHLLHAISFKISDSTVFVNYFQIFVLILTAATPIVAYFLQSSYRSIPKLAFAVLAGLLLAVYSAEYAGEGQVESFGAAFACIAIFAMAMPNFEKRKILWISLVSIGILGACGFKEPFLFVIFGASLILCNDIKAWLYRFLLPLIIAILLGVIILLIFSWLDDFLYYFNYIRSSHISRFGSPFLRAMNFSKLYDGMNQFSWGLAIALLVLLSFPFVLFIANSKLNESNLFIKIIFWGTAFFLVSYSVGLGGEYFWHHYVFALPFYMALILFLFKSWNGENSAVIKLGLVSFVFLAIATLNLSNLDSMRGRTIEMFMGEAYKETYMREAYMRILGLDSNRSILWDLNKRKEVLDYFEKEFMHVAAYVDYKMDELGIDRYAQIGAPTSAYTKHSPYGPYINIDEKWFKYIPGYLDSIISNINKADIVVVGDPWIPPAIAARANPILNEHFTRQQVGWYGVYFRKKRLVGKPL